MLIIQFEGWFQCRLARDPDPTHEPRGVSGATFALIHEPDFDRIIRLHDPCCERTLAGQDGRSGAVPTVGVFVTKSEIGKEDEKRGSALRGARVRLLDEPKFEGWNNAVTIAGAEPIHPFHLEITDADGTVLIDREDVLDPSDDKLSIFDLHADSAALKRRQPAFEPNSKAVGMATGITEPVAYMEDRVSLLREALEAANDAAERIAFQQRIDGLQFVPEDDFICRALVVDDDAGPDLDWLRRVLGSRAGIQLGAQARMEKIEDEWIVTDPSSESPKIYAVRATPNTGVMAIFELVEDWRTFVLRLALGARMVYAFDMNGPEPFVHERVGESEPGAPWPIRFWMGGWDNDALCGYMKGELQIPMR